MRNNRDKNIFFLQNLNMRSQKQMQTRILIHGFLELNNELGKLIASNNLVLRKYIRIQL